MTSAPLRLPHPASHRQVVEALLIAFLALVAGALVLAGGLGDSSGTQTEAGSGRIVSQARTLPEFGALDMAGTNNVTVRVGPVQRVVVRADDNLLDNVTTVVRRGELVIGETGSFRTSGVMQVDVTVPSLQALALSGTGTLTAEGIGVDRLLVTMSGTGMVRASGVADWLRARLTGDGAMRLEAVHARHISAWVAGTGQITVPAGGSLESHVTGTGAVVRR